MELSNLRKEGKCSIIPLGVRFFLTESLNRRTLNQFRSNSNRPSAFYGSLSNESLWRPLPSLNYSGVLSYLLEFLAWGFGLPSDLYLDTRQCRLSFRELTHKLLGQYFDGFNPTCCRLGFEFLFDLTSREGNRGQGVREKVNSFSIVEISLSLEFSV